MVCPSRTTGSLSVSEQVPPAATQTRAGCICQSSLRGSLQDMATRSEPDHHMSQTQRDDWGYNHYFPKVPTLTRTTALKPVAIARPSGKQAVRTSGNRYDSSSTSGSPDSLKSSRQTDATSDCPEKLISEEEDDRNSIDILFPFARKLSTLKLRRKKTSRPSIFQREAYEDENEDALLAELAGSLHLAPQDPPPDLSNSVVSTWSHIYRDSTIDTQDHEIANNLIDELDHSFSPTLDNMHGNTYDRNVGVESTQATHIPEPEWFVEDKWWGRRSMDGERKGILRGGYDSRHTHVEYASSF